MSANSQQGFKITHNLDQNDKKPSYFKQEGERPSTGLGLGRRDLRQGILKMLPKSRDVLEKEEASASNFPFAVTKRYFYRNWFLYFITLPFSVSCQDICYLFSNT